MANQRMSHSRANTLVDRKAYFHPRRYTRKPTAKGASVAPIFVPELKMPVAKARSLAGNHSATALIDAGKFPASPKPSMNLAMPNAITAPDRAVIDAIQCADPRPGKR